MNYGKPFAALAMCALLSGCNTFSFAPPVVEIDKPISGPGGAFCGFEPDSGAAALEKDIEGALALVQNFLVTYRCASREAADGRQVFEVPSLLALAVAGLGPSFGLDDDGRLAAAGSAAVYARGNSYYAPKEKTRFLDAALDAVICVKTRAVGVGFLDTRQGDDNNDGDTEELQQALEQTVEETRELEQMVAELDKQWNEQVALAEKSDDSASLMPSSAEYSLKRQQTIERIDQLKWERWELSRQVNRLLLAKASRDERLTISSTLPGGTVEIDVERQYYDLISGSLFAVERVLARRLSEVGGDFDGSGLTAEIKQLTQEEEEIKEDRNDAADAPVSGSQPSNKQVDPTTGVLSFKSDAQKNAELVRLDLAQLQTQMQQCVVRAKM